MRFVTFALAFGLAIVQISALPSVYKPCDEVLSDHLMIVPVTFQESLLVGCHLFHNIADSLKELDLDDILQQCQSACLKNFLIAEKNRSCSLGCKLMYENKQGSSDATVGSSIKAVTEEIKHQTSTEKKGATKTTILTEKDYKKQYYEEYAKLQYWSVLQMIIFCCVMLAILVCSIKVVVLIYRLKYAAVQYMLNNANNEDLPVASIQVRTCPKKDLLIEQQPKK